MSKYLELKSQLRQLNCKYYLSNTETAHLQTDTDNADAAESPS